MEMVWQKTKPSQPHRNFLVGLPHQTYERGEVLILMEDITSPIAPVQDMVN